MDISLEIKNKCEEYFRVERFIEGFRILNIEDPEENAFQPTLYKITKNYELEKMSLMAAISSQDGMPDRKLIPKYFGFLFATGLADKILFITKGLLYEEKKSKGVHDSQEYLLGMIIDCDGIKYNMAAPQTFCKELCARLNHDIYSIKDASDIDPPTENFSELKIDGSLWLTGSEANIELSDFDIPKETIRVAESLNQNSSWD